MKLKTWVACLVGVAALHVGVGADGSLGWSQAQAQEKVSPEMGKQLQAVQGLLKGAKYKEALAKLKDAEAIGNRSAAENAFIEQLRMAAAQGAQDPDTMVRAFDALKGSGRLSAAQNLQYLEAIAGTYLRVNQSGKALQWANRYFSEGGTSTTMKQVQTSAQYQAGDVGPIVKATLAEVQEADKAGKAPPKDKLNLLLNAAARAKDGAAEAIGTELMLKHYPSKEYWADAVARVQTRKGFSDRFMIDLFRLRLATGNMRGEADYMEMAQLAAQSGSPEEGRRVVDAGEAAGILGKGKDAARHQRLKEFMDKKSADSKAAYPAAEKEANDAKDGNALVQLGLQQALRGEAKKGASMIEAGIAKGQLRREADANLALGLAYHLAGDASKSQAAWRKVRGSDGVADVANLYAIQARQAKR